MTAERQRAHSAHHPASPIQHSVMAGLVPAIHVFVVLRPQDVDARHKAGHDGGGLSVTPLDFIPTVNIVLSVRLIEGRHLEAS